jgi:hypothetical protein
MENAPRTGETRRIRPIEDGYGGVSAESVVACSESGAAEPEVGHTLILLLRLVELVEESDCSFDVHPGEGLFLPPTPSFQLEQLRGGKG